MKNRIFRFIALLALSVCLAIAMAGCDILGLTDAQDQSSESECQHTAGGWNVSIAPTCAASGTRVKLCTKCDVELEREEIPKLLEHTPGDWITDTEPTCYAVGEKHMQCTVCGALLASDIVEKTAHTPGDAARENEVAPSCTVNGYYEEVVYCSALGCGAELSRIAETITATGHTPAASVVENNESASCFEGGSYDEVVYCSVNGCGAELSRTAHTLPATSSHVPAAAVLENEIAPTCTVAGSYDEVVYCSVRGCGAELSRTAKTVPAPGHTAAEAVTENVVDPGCLTPGSYELVVYCSALGCSAELSRVPGSIDPQGHTPAAPVEENVVDSTCVAVGSRDMVVYCSVLGCGCELSRVPEEISLKDHSPTAVTVENRVDSTCISEGSYDEVIYCSRIYCNAEISRISKSISVQDHRPGDFITDEEPTCIAEGVGHTECVWCGITTSTDPIPVVGHHVGDAPVFENVRASTCTKDGSRDEVAYCMWCSLELSRESVTVSKLSHVYVGGKCSTCGVEENASQGLVYTSNGDGTAYVSSVGTCADSDVVIASVSPDGDRVTSIGVSAFENSAVTSVLIPNTVTHIGASAFKGCSALTSLNIPESVTGMGTAPFSGCALLFDVEDGIYYVDNWAIGSDTSITSAIVREGTVGIGVYAFMRRSELVSVELPETLKYMMIGAFEECIKLESVSIPASLEVLAENAFSNCYALNSVSLSDGLVEIERNAFASCLALSEIDLPDTLQYIGQSAFLNTAIISLTLPDSVTTVCAGAFGGCTSLTAIHIGSGVKDLNNSNMQNPFNGCTSLLTITVSEDNDSFLTLDGHLYSINGESLALVCYAVASPDTEFTVPDNVTGIWHLAASAALNLEHLYVPSSSTTWIGESAFSRCKQLKTVTIGDGVRLINEGAFKYCSALTTVSLGKSVEQIGNECFGSTALSSVTFASIRGWECISYYSPAVIVTLEESNIRNSSTAAKYLKTTYCNYIWRR